MDSETNRIDRIRRLLREWERRYRYRQDLKRLLKVGDGMILDIGLTLEAARAESRKPFWRA